MQTSYFWDKLHLHRQKIIFTLLCVLMLFSGAVFGQNNNVLRDRENLLEYDQRLLTYGFTLGMHSSSLRLKFDEDFTREGAEYGYDTVANIVARNGFGFSIGFLANLRLAQYLDVRVMPKVGFYQYSIDHQYEGTLIDDRNFFADFTTVDMPVLLKYKSHRRKNFRMFYVAGLTPTLDVTGKKQREENEEDGLQLYGDNLSLEIGFGSDIYFPLFRFSPEIRYSYGLVNVLKNYDNNIGYPFSRITTQSISLYLVFN